MTKTPKKEHVEDVDTTLQTPKTGRTGDGEREREKRENEEEKGEETGRHREAGRRHKEIRKKKRKTRTLASSLSHLWECSRWRLWRALERVSLRTSGQRAEPPALVSSHMFFAAEDLLWP